MANDPENDYHNKRVNCCYTSKLYSIESEADSIAELMLKFAMNKPELLSDSDLRTGHEETKNYKIQSQIVEFPDLCQQFMLVWE